MLEVNGLQGNNGRKNVSPTEKNLNLINKNRRKKMLWDYLDLCSISSCDIRYCPTCFLFDRFLWATQQMQ